MSHVPYYPFPIPPSPTSSLGISPITLLPTLSPRKDADDGLLNDSGSGDRLPPLVLLLATLSAGFATLLSLWTIWLQLKNYRKVALQRWVVRILVMVPIYSISSLVSLYSLGAAFYLDAVRDIYEAFVIYCFFSLLVEYLGGERSLIISLHGRPPTPHIWPINTCLRPMDVSDPYTFLGLKRGILQYVQIKPILAILTMVFKATGTYNDGSLRADSGYTYVSIVYNISIFLSLYCLAMFWVCTSEDLKPYRPMPKFLCVKGIVFLTFWQGFCISILVAIGILKSKVYPQELLSLAVQDTLICFEMPLFAFLHLYAFSHKDYIDPQNQYAGRLPVIYALRDSLFGFRDVFEDSLTTFRGTGFSYRTFEPAEGGIHQGQGRERRVKAGLRYSEGGKAKYWLPMPGTDASQAYGRKGGWSGLRRPFESVRRAMEERRADKDGYAPISPEEARDVVHRDPREVVEGQEQSNGLDPFGSERWEAGLYKGVDGREERRQYDSEMEDEADSDGESLAFGEPGREEEDLYKDSRKLEFGDYNFPVLDASKEEARRKMREEEEAIVFGRRVNGRTVRGSKGKSETPKSKGKGKASSRDSSERSGLLSHFTGGEGSSNKTNGQATHSIGEDSDEGGDADEEVSPGEYPGQIREGCVDIIVEDKNAEEDEMIKERKKGEPAHLGGKKKKVFRRAYTPNSGTSSPAQSSSSLPTPPPPNKDHPATHPHRPMEMEGGRDDVPSTDGKVVTAKDDPHTLVSLEEVDIAREKTPPPFAGEMRFDHEYGGHHGDDSRGGQSPGHATPPAGGSENPWSD